MIRGGIADPGAPDPPAILSDHMTGTPLSTGVRPRRSPRPDVLGVLWVLAAGAAVLAPALSPRPLPGAVRLGVALRPVEEPERRRPRPPGLRPDRRVHPVDEAGVDPGPPRPAPAVEPLQRARAAAGVQLAGRHVQHPGSGRATSFPVRLAYTVQVLATLVIAGTGVYVLGRVLRLRVVELRHGGHGVRAERLVLRLAGLAHRLGDVVDGMAVRRDAAHRARRGTGPGPSPSSP